MTISKNQDTSSYKVYILSLGCDKNRVDSEKLLYVLTAHEQSPNTHRSYACVDEPECADIIIVNTCSFIDDAKAESIDAILELAEYKKTGSLKILVVVGCLVWRYGKELKKSLPEVDIFFADYNFAEITKTISQFIAKNECIVHIGEQNSCFNPTGRVLTTPNHYAYLKIAEGCDNHCTYCAIPSIRGKYRSYTIEDLVSEAIKLNEMFDVQELNLIAQDLTRYGLDLYHNRSLIKLLEELTKIDFKRIRLLYCYPEHLTDEIIDFVINNSKMCQYFDIPMQHISDAILKRMGRRTTSSEICKLIENIRSKSNAVIRSTFIAGFPGETDKEFYELCAFLEQFKLDYAGFFAYSKESGTAASKLSGMLVKKTKVARREKLYEIQSKIMEYKAREKIGKTFSVLFDGFDCEKGMFYGRTDFQAPSVDPVVYINSKKPLDAGMMYNVNITKKDGFDLIGDVL